jgi:hypothetical protein
MHCPFDDLAPDLMSFCVVRCPPFITVHAPSSRRQGGLFHVHGSRCGRKPPRHHTSQPYGSALRGNAPPPAAGRLLTRTANTHPPHPRVGCAASLSDLLIPRLACFHNPAEVYQNHPYNEKSDVFSFGVLAYELLASEMLVISVFNTGQATRLRVKEPHDYAERVGV